LIPIKAIPGGSGSDGLEMEAAMLKLDVARTGLVFGLLIGGLHAMWA